MAERSAAPDKPFCPHLREIGEIDQTVRENAADPGAWTIFLADSLAVRQDMVDSLGGADPYYQALTSAEMYELLQEIWDSSVAEQAFSPAEVQLLSVFQPEERVLEARAEQFCDLTLEPVVVAPGVEL